MRKLVQFGIGKIGQVVSHHFSTDSDYQLAAYAVDPAFVPADGQFGGLPVVGFDEVEHHFSPSDHDMFIAIGYQQLNRLRAMRYDEARRKGYRLATYISSQNRHCSRDQVGENCFIMSGEPLQPHAQVGDNCFVWTGALIGHHAQVANHGWVTSGVVIGGNSQIGEYCFLGLGAVIGHEVNIGSHCLIGAGALIARDAPDHSVYIEAETPRFRLTSEQFLKMNTLK